jgi:ribosome recycling factor
MAEEGKISVRNHRRDSNEMLKELKNEKEISEDDFFRAQEEVQQITDEYTKKIDEVTAEKEKEIMEF